MLIRPTVKELEEFGTPDFIIYNAGQFPANRFTAGMTSSTSVEVNFKRKEMVILGTEYAGEMKKGIFSVMVRSALLRGAVCTQADSTTLRSTTSSPSSSDSSPSTLPLTRESMAT